MGDTNRPANLPTCDHGIICGGGRNHCPECDKRDIEIANKMNEGEGKDYFYISGFWMFHHIHK